VERDLNRRRENKSMTNCSTGRFAWQKNVTRIVAKSSTPEIQIDGKGNAQHGKEQVLEITKRQH
jgi:hypothetical protein